MNHELSMLYVLSEQISSIFEFHSSLCKKIYYDDDTEKFKKAYIKFIDECTKLRKSYEKSLEDVYYKTVERIHKNKEIKKTRSKVAKRVLVFDEWYNYLITANEMENDFKKDVDRMVSEFHLLVIMYRKIGETRPHLKKFGLISSTAIRLLLYPEMFRNIIPFSIQRSVVPMLIKE